MNWLQQFGLKQMPEDFYLKDTQQQLHDSNQSAPFDIVEAFGRGVVNALEDPVNAVTQMWNHMRLENLVKLPQINTFQMQAYKPGSAEWIAQNMGYAVGWIAPWLLFRKGFNKVFDFESKYTAMEIGTKRTMAMTADYALNGAILDFTFVPTPKDQEKNFWSDRLKMAVTGAVTLAAMIQASSFFHYKLGEGPLRLVRDSLFEKTGSQIPWFMIDGMQYGAFAGVAGAQTHALLETGRFASNLDTLSNSVFYSTLAGTLGVRYGRLADAAQPAVPSKKP